jgi:hypothetical protein
MALESHIDELMEKHRKLDRKIEEKFARLGSDDLELAELKKEKLRLKDQIAQLAAKH